MKTVQLADLDVFTAIAHPVRRQILDLLRQETSTVKTLAQAFEISRPAISQHLRVLLDANLVQMKALGRENYYELQPTALQTVFEWVQHYQIFWNTKLDALDEFLRQPDET